MFVQVHLPYLKHLNLIPELFLVMLDQVEIPVSIQALSYQLKLQILLNLPFAEFHMPQPPLHPIIENPNSSLSPVLTFLLQEFPESDNPHMKLPESHFHQYPPG